MASNFASASLDEKVKMKGMLSVLCECNKRSVGHLKWLKKTGTEEKPLNDQTNPFRDNGQELKLTDVTLDGEVTYACTCGDARIECCVKSEVSEVKCSKPLKSLKVEENQELLLNCEFEVQDGSAVWSKDKVHIKQGKRLIYAARDNRYELTLKDTTEKDSGEYRCVYKGVQTTFAIKVENLPKEKMTFTFICDGAKPDYQIKWMKDSEELKSDGRISFPSDMPAPRLVIRNVAKGDEGSYSCVYGNAITTCNIEVEEIPRFIKCLDNQTVMEKDTLTLNCKLSRTDISVKWFKEEEEIKNDSRVTISSQNGQHNMKIKDIGKGDAGIYSCECRDFTKVDTSCTIRVEELPKFTKFLEHQTAKEKDILTLNCKLSRPAVFVTWFKDDKEIKNDGRVTISSQNGQHNLKIDDIGKGDAGIYKCECTDYNGIGTSCTIRVEELPKFTTFLDNHTVNEKETLTLNCNLSRPAISVKWFKDDKEIKNDGRVTISSQNGQHNLKIDDIGKGDAGIYRCECKDYKEIITSCSIRVEDTAVAWMKSPIFVLVCSIVLNAVITSTGILGGTSSAKPYQSREVNELVYRIDDIDKTISTVKQQQKTDTNSLSLMLEEYKDKVLKKDKNEFESMSYKLEEVTRNISTKADGKNLTDIKSNFEKRLDEMKDTFTKRVEEMQDEFSNRLENLSKFTGEFSRTLSEYRRTFENFEKETNEKIKEYNILLTDLSSTVEHDLKGMLETVKDQVKGIEEAKQKADELLGGLQGDVNRIIPNTFNKEALTMAFMVLIVFVFMLALWIYKVQTSITAGGPEQHMDMNAKDVLQRLPRRVALSNALCIISFDEARKDAHEALIKSAIPTLGNIKTEYFVIRRHEHLLKMPKCKFYIMCTEFSERHVIIEEPGLGLGDLKRCTYETIQRYGAKMIILYTRDPGSRNLGDQLYNHKIHCVSAQPELSGLRDQGRFFSTYDDLSATQKKALKDTVANCLE